MAETQEQFLVDRKGKRTAVVIPLKKYQQLLEDLHDLAIIAERRNEPSISLDELKRKAGDLHSDMQRIAENY